MSLEARLLREAAYSLSGTDPQETQALLQMAAAKIDELHTLLADRDARLAALNGQKSEENIPGLAADESSFIRWAEKEKYDISCHPMFFVMLDAETYAARMGWKAAKAYYAAAGAAPNAWKDAILDVMTLYGMDAPTTDAPEKIIKDLIELATRVAIDPTIAAGTAPAPMELVLTFNFGTLVKAEFQDRILYEVDLSPKSYFEVCWAHGWAGDYETEEDAENECLSLCGYSRSIREVKPGDDGYKNPRQPQLTEKRFLLAAAGAAPVPCVVLTPEERAAFERFHETWEDNEGYDVPKEMMRRLTEVGVVHHITAGRYDITKFGHYVLAAGVAPVHEGWQLVPVEPTDAMLVSARDWSYAKYGKPIGNTAAVGCWEAMLSAAAKDARTKETK